MLQYLKGFNTTVFSLLMATITFVVLNHFPHLWYPFLPTISQLLFVILALTGVFAAQFNHSRLTLLSGVLLLLAFSQVFNLPWSKFLVEHKDWLILQNVFLLAGLSFIKDRGLLSIHGLYRLLFITAIGGGAYLWQVSAAFILDTVAQSSSAIFSDYSHWLNYLLFEVPFAIVLLLLLWRSLTQISSLSAALLITCIYFIGAYYQLISIAWQLCYFALGVYYLLVVVVDSYFLAYRDDLTTLPSRRALNQLALSLGRKYSVAMLDIDHFKKFNDTYGHDIGDQVLKLVAARLKEVKDGGKVFRYGGEEFTIVFPRKNIEQVLYALETVRQSIADYKVVIRHPLRTTKQARQQTKAGDVKKVSVTISIGVASRSGKLDFTQVLKMADQALYRAKKNGRNNVSQ